MLRPCYRRARDLQQISRHLHLSRLDGGIRRRQGKTPLSVSLDLSHPVLQPVQHGLEQRGHCASVPVAANEASEVATAAARGVVDLAGMVTGCGAGCDLRLKSRTHASTIRASITTPPTLMPIISQGN